MLRHVPRPWKAFRQCSSWRSDRDRCVLQSIRTIHRQSIDFEDKLVLPKGFQDIKNHEPPKQTPTLEASAEQQHDFISGLLKQKLGDEYKKPLLPPPSLSRSSPLSHTNKEAHSWTPRKVGKVLPIRTRRMVVKTPTVKERNDAAIALMGLQPSPSQDQSIKYDNEQQEDYFIDANVLESPAELHPTHSLLREGVRLDTSWGDLTTRRDMSKTKMTYALPRKGITKSENGSVEIAKDKAAVKKHLRENMRLLSHPMAIMLTGSSANSCRGLTITSFSTVSFDPDPVISFNVKFPSRAGEMLLTRRRFTLNFLRPTAEAVYLAEIFAGKLQLPSEETIKELVAGETSKKDIESVASSESLGSDVAESTAESPTNDNLSSSPNTNTTNALDDSLRDSSKPPPRRVPTDYSQLPLPDGRYKFGPEIAYPNSGIILRCTVTGAYTVQDHKIVIAKVENCSVHRDGDGSAILDYQHGKLRLTPELEERLVKHGTMAHEQVRALLNDKTAVNKYRLECLARDETVIGQPVDDLMRKIFREESEWLNGVENYKDDFFRDVINRIVAPVYGPPQPNKSEVQEPPPEELKQEEDEDDVAEISLQEEEPNVRLGQHANERKSLKEIWNTDQRKEDDH